MKKIFLLVMLVSFGFGAVFGCKSENSIGDLASKAKSERFNYAQVLMLADECRILQDFRVIKHGYSVSQVSYLGKVWYVAPRAVSKF